jgi:two-component system sensor histidine kinase CssS
MTIRSYAQAIRDGIYPKGDLSATVQVIEEEAGRLEKRIHNLLYLTKLDYLATYRPAYQAVALVKLIGDVVERLRWRRSELDWSLKLSPLKIRGDMEQWRVVLENILDNQVRYARGRIVVSLSPAEEHHEKAALLHICNDGPPIEPEVMDILFHKFNRGYKGEFGLGLAIAYRIVSLHNARIWAKNEAEGVSFYLKIPSHIDPT